VLPRTFPSPQQGISRVLPSSAYLAPVRLPVARSSLQSDGEGTLSLTSPWISEGAEAPFVFDFVGPLALEGSL